jgi:hypothetical protein
VNRDFNNMSFHVKLHLNLDHKCPLRDFVLILVAEFGYVLMPIFCAIER